MAVLAAGLAVAACASKPALAPSDQTNDPFERLNRAIFQSNLALDKALFRPMAEGYRAVVPTPVRRSVRNVLNNLDSPTIFVNDVLQGQMQRAGITVARAGVNSTFGILGVLDVAENLGLPRHTEDFGQTLAVYGISEGPYLFLPVIGPAPPRDLLGWSVDFLFDPLTYARGTNHYYWASLRGGLDALDLRERNIETLDELEQQSVDFYASIRGLYRQTRNNEITNGRTPAEELPNF